MLRLLRLAALALLGAYLAIVALYFIYQRTLLYPGATGQKVDFQQTPPWGEWSQIQTPDGQALASLYRAPADGRPTILLFPGNGDNIVNYGFLDAALGEARLGFLAVSYRGYPGSTGSPDETGLLIDGVAAFDWLNAKSSASPIVILGRSLGTGVAVNTAAERIVAGLVLVSPYDSVGAVAQDLYPWLPARPLVRDSFRSDLRIGKVQAPKLFLHGEQDALIPIAHGRALFDKAAGPKLFEALPLVGHGNIWNDDVLAKILAFADQFAKSR